MDLLLHAVAQCGIHELVTRDQSLACKRSTYDNRLKVGAVTGHFNMLAVQTIGDVSTNVFRGGQHSSQRPFKF